MKPRYIIWSLATCILAVTACKKDKTNTISSYNTTIKAVAATMNLPVFDAYALLNQLKTSITQDGVTLNTSFISGGFFSLDGTHFTPRGNAYVTDEMIKVINAKYGSKIPALDISSYNAVKVN